MPSYTFNHMHHETKDSHAAAEWYKTLFDAQLDEPELKDGVTWIRAHIGPVTITITDREFSDMDLGRYQGYDHLALTTDDFDGTLARIEEVGANIWAGPIANGGPRLVFVNGPDNVKIEILEKA